MISGKLFKTVAASVLVLSLGVGFAYAGADEMIQARQAQMKAQGKAIGALVAIIKGEAPYDAAVIKASMDAMKAAADTAMAANGWSADSLNGATIETWAKPEIWSDAEGFKAAYGALVKAEDGVAASTDEASFTAAFGELGGACKNCHEKFRRPKG